MAPILPAGPFEFVDLGGGVSAPLYLIPFDKRGRVKAPQTRQHLIEAGRDGGFSHVFLFSHGWNNDFPTALARYRRFFAEFREIREQQGTPEAYKPLLVGVIWPSTFLVLPGERPPKMAALPDEPDLEPAIAADLALDELEEIAELLPDDEVERFLGLAGRTELLGEAEASELARILQPLYAAPDDPAASGDDAPTAVELVAIWRAAQDVLGGPAPTDADEEDFGAVPGLGGAAAGDASPEAAGLGFLDPRSVVRSFTVWKMKDRAGKVGTAGVGPLLADLVAAAGPASIHLIGHSYGAKVVLSAANSLPDGSDGKVASALLLQPAINGWAFAEDVEDEGFPGGYRRVLDIVAQPIFSTFSSKDRPLTLFFHLAVRRHSDLGEVKVAAGAPSRFAALGGFGPRGVPGPRGGEIEMPAAGTAYPVDLPSEIVGLQGGALIDGHGDVTTPHTAWALFQQVARASGGDG